MLLKNKYRLGVKFSESLEHELPRNIHFFKSAYDLYQTYCAEILYCTVFGNLKISYRDSKILKGIEPRQVVYEKISNTTKLKIEEFKSNHREIRTDEPEFSQKKLLESECLGYTFCDENLWINIKNNNIFFEYYEDEEKNSKRLKQYRKKLDELLVESYKNETFDLIETSQHICGKENQIFLHLLAQEFKEEKLYNLFNKKYFSLNSVITLPKKERNQFLERKKQEWLGHLLKEERFLNFLS